MKLSKRLFNFVPLPVIYLNFIRNNLNATGLILLLWILLPPKMISAQETPDLVITNARVLDVETGEVRQNRSIIIRDGLIVGISEVRPAATGDARIIDAHDSLLTPGLVDVHGHTAYVLGDSVSAGGGYITHLDPSPDSLNVYRKTYAQAYLPHGVTTVRDVGSKEKDIKILRNWWTEPAPDLPDFYPSGGALVSPPPQGRSTYPGHEVVQDAEAARYKVQSYYDQGIRHIKLYWRLREPEFGAALDEAQPLDMNVTGHVDFHVLGFRKALDLGLRSFEHAYTVGVGALTDAEYRSLWQNNIPGIYGNRQRGLFHLAMLEVFNLLGPDDPDTRALIDRLAETGSTVSTSLHIFAQQAGMAPFRIHTGTPFDDVSGLTKKQRNRARQGYELLADYVREMHTSGVRLALAPDWLEPGRVALSEMWLLNRAGIPMTDVMRIATLNGARAIGLEDRGTVEPGMKADLVIWQENPLEDPDALFAEKSVIRSGMEVDFGK